MRRLEETREERKWIKSKEGDKEGLQWQGGEEKAREQKVKCREEVKEGRVMKEVRTVELACKLRRRRRFRTRAKEKRRRGEGVEESFCQERCL